jgi:hypothetical protein
MTGDEAYAGTIKYVDERLKDAAAARGDALSAMNKRLDGMNEFRDTLRDQAAQFLTRKEYDAKHEVLTLQIRALELSKAVLDGKASQGAVIAAYIVSGIGILISLIDLVSRFLAK